MPSAQYGGFRDGHLVANLYIVGMNNNTRTNIARKTYLNSLSSDGGEVTNTTIVPNAKLIVAHNDRAEG